MVVYVDDYCMGVVEQNDIKYISVDLLVLQNMFRKPDLKEVYFYGN